MPALTVSSENNTLRQRFFALAFGNQTGYLCLASKYKGELKQAFFRYPDDLPKALEWINRSYVGRDLYFCPQLLTKAERKKQYVGPCTNLWADLDEANPDNITDYPPSVVLETSPARFQALWLLDRVAEPQDAENASRRIAYTYGADTSGWDLTQLLRIPATYNNKPAYEDKPQVVLRKAEDIRYALESFLAFDDVPEFKEIDLPFPERTISGLNAETILKENRNKLLPMVFTLYTIGVKRDWSSALWSLECNLLEAGLTPEETFVVCESSAVNKYERDKRPRVELWQEVLKAKLAIDLRVQEETTPIQLEPLLTEAEQQVVDNLKPTFVDMYVEWARKRTDAYWEYHEAAAFTILGAILAEAVKLPTSWGTIIPNLWFMLLGDTTLTRKTTAMEMGIEYLLTIYPDSILATDGTVEGMMKALVPRSYRSSLFYRDEFAGMLEAMRRKDYLGGMIESFTKLYDVKYQKKVLSRDTIELKDPIFMMLTGGIETRIMELLTPDYIINGFVPRFIFIIGHPEMDKLRPAGPPTEELNEMSVKIVSEVSRLRELYDNTSLVMVGDEAIETPGEAFRAELTPEAWERYNLAENEMIRAGVYSEHPELYTPTMDRLAKSGLKVALLIAASRQDPRKGVIVELQDILKALSYLQRWVRHTIKVIDNAGKTVSEKTLERAFDLIKRGKDSRSGLMRAMKWSSREAEWALDTLEQRGMITRSKQGRNGPEKLFPTIVGR